MRQVPSTPYQTKIMKFPTLKVYIMPRREFWEVKAAGGRPVYAQLFVWQALSCVSQGT